MSFQPGDKVVINRGVIAEIVVYDTEANRLVYKHEVGGGTNTVYGHISNTQIDAFPSAPAVVEDADPEPAA